MSEELSEIGLIGLAVMGQNLALNIAELKRFIGQQDEIIVYYEEALTDESNLKDTPTNGTSND